MGTNEVTPQHTYWADSRAIFLLDEKSWESPHYQSRTTNINLLDSSGSPCNGKSDAFLCESIDCMGCWHCPIKYSTHTSTSNTLSRSKNRSASRLGLGKWRPLNQTSQTWQLKSKHANNTHIWQRAVSFTAFYNDCNGLQKNRKFQPSYPNTDWHWFTWPTLIALSLWSHCETR